MGWALGGQEPRKSCCALCPRPAVAVSRLSLRSRAWEDRLWAQEQQGRPCLPCDSFASREAALPSPRHSVSCQTLGPCGAGHFGEAPLLIWDRRGAVLRVESHVKGSVHTFCDCLCFQSLKPKKYLNIL